MVWSPINLIHVLFLVALYPSNEKLQAAIFANNQTNWLMFLNRDVELWLFSHKAFLDEWTAAWVNFSLPVLLIYSAPTGTLFSAQYVLTIVIYPL